MAILEGQSKIKIVQFNLNKATYSNKALSLGRFLLLLDPFSPVRSFYGGLFISGLN